LIDSFWPEISLERDLELEKNNILLFDIIKEIRNIRAESNILPNKTIGLKIYAKGKSLSVVEENLTLIA
jgi:valyl-tRNA synthetase